jgi:hypothetical protein|tara:strand:- start:3185 stop:3601 length:417 start_codon:yes stop_codon:yes gene_type:complete
VDKEHILKLQKGDIALVITSDNGWFQKINIAFADDTDNPIQMNQEWLSLYKATTHLSMICDTYLRSRQNLMQESGEDIISEQEWNADMLDPFVLKDYLTDLGYSTPPELQKEVDEFMKEETKEKKGGDNVIQLFPEKS